MANHSLEPTALDPLDLARIRIATEDHAARFYGRHGGHTFGRGDAVRYTAEGPCGQLCDRYGLKAVWQAVEAVVDERPQLLTDSSEVRQRRAEQRAARCDQLAREAYVLWRGGDDPAPALELIDEAELLDPDHLAAGRHRWSDIRRVIENGGKR